MAQMVSVDVVEAMRSATIQVELKRVREMHVRIWLALLFVRFAAWIMNCNIEFKDD